MCKTTGGRLQLVRESLEMNQQEMALLLGVGQGTISAMELRDTPIKKKYLDMLEREHKVSPAYVQSGVGEMFLAGAVVSEPKVSYGRIVDFNEHGMRARFQAQVNDYMRKFRVNQKEVASEFQINETYLSKVMNDMKHISLAMLLKAHRYGKFNLNFTASGEGGYYMGEGNVELMKQIKELQQLVHVLNENARLKSGEKNRA